MLVGDVRERLADVTEASIQCVVTSPPYWGGQRDYGHPGQIGMERTPEEFRDVLVDVFGAVHRVLKPNGVLWLNLGDSYAASGKGGGGKLMKKRGQAWGHRDRMRGWRKAPPGYKSKDIVGVPWLVAVALRGAGWYLRRDIVWDKTISNEATRADRPVSQHEMVFLLTKSPRYLYNLPESQETSVWRFRPDGSYGGHSATFPKALVSRCISAASGPGDVVLDPFCGSGTTGEVAIGLGRKFVGIELNAEYAELSRDRIRNTTPPLFTEATA